MNSKGVTLVELLLYVALVGIVMALISSPLQKMLKTTSSQQREASLQSSSRDVISMLSREIRNTGFKRYILSGSTYNATVIPKTFLAADSSSFILRQGDPSDTLTIYKATIDNSGYSTGGVDSVKYYIGTDTTLKRKLGTVETTLAGDVKALQFMLGQLATDSLLFNADTFVTSHWGKTGVAAIALSGSDLAVNYSGSGSGTVTLATANKFTVNTASRIKLTYNITNGINVLSNIDSLRWSIVNASGTLAASDYFKPGYQTGSIILPIKAALPVARVELRAVCKGVASLVINKIEIRKIDLGNIIWSDTIAVNKKKYVKAIKIMVLQRSTNKADSYTGGSVKVANIKVNRSGSYAWRLLNETVDISNNGLF